MNEVRLALRPGDVTATVDGKPVTMLAAPAVLDGSLAASGFLFEDARGIECLLLYIGNDAGTAWGEWYIVP